MLKPMFFLGWILAATSSLTHASERRSNIILIIADDLGYGELGCYGGSEIPTPHLDALASEGAVFTNAYVTASYCAASRAAMLTSRYQTRFGFEFNPIGATNSKPGIGLPTSETTIADEMRNVGYATGLVGKWHLGGTADYHPQRRGFDEFFGFLHEGHYFVPHPFAGVTTWLRRKSLPDGSSGRWSSADGRVHWSTHLNQNEPPYDTDNPIMRSSQPVAEADNLTTAFTREACDFINRHVSQPFFLCVAYNAVHSPLQGQDNYMQKFAHIDDIQRRIFAAMLAHLDDGVGQVVATIDRNQIAERTLVVFISDNGGPTKELTSSNYPLRGGKGNLYEGGIRIPMIVRLKNVVPPAVINTPVSSMDIGATALDLANVVSQPGKPNPQGSRGSSSNSHRDGISLMPSLNSPESHAAPHEFLAWRMGNRQALRQGNWKIVRSGTGNWELYDLENDIGESKDLAAHQAARLRSMVEIWSHWNSQQVEPLWR